MVNDTPRQWTQSTWLLAAGWGSLLVGLSLIAFSITEPWPTPTRVATIMAAVALIEGWGACALIQRGIAASSLAGVGKAAGYLAAVAAVVAFVGLTLAGNPYVRSHLLTVSGLKLAAIPVAIGASFCEELVFRGWLMNRLALSRRSTATQILISALTFGLAHVYAFGGFRPALAAQASATLFGVMLATVYILGGRKLGPAIFAHGLVDFLIEPWLIIGFFA